MGFPKRGVEKPGQRFKPRANGEKEYGLRWEAVKNPPPKKPEEKYFGLF